MSILIISAHPDDETLGCGGTIAKYAAQNKEVHILILGEGIRSRSGTPRPEDEQAIEQLRKNARSAGKILGAASVSFESFPDNRFDSIPLLDIVKRIEAHIEHRHPHTLFTQHGGDLNIDHSITFRATLTAARPVEGSRIKSIFTYETLSSTEWAFEQISPGFSPNLFIDIRDYLHLKIKAMEAYENEIKLFPHPRSPKAIKALAHRRGSTTGLHCAEAFSIIRSIEK